MPLSIFIDISDGDKILVVRGVLSQQESVPSYTAIILHFWFLHKWKKMTNIKNEALDSIYFNQATTGTLKKFVGIVNQAFLILRLVFAFWWELQDPGCARHIKPARKCSKLYCYNFTLLISSQMKKDDEHKKWKALDSHLFQSSNNWNPEKFCWNR